MGFSVWGSLNEKNLNSEIETRHFITGRGWCQVFSQ